jgi:hypothetical protein
MNIDRMWHSGIVEYHLTNICYCLTVANLNEMLSKTRRATRKFHMDRFEMKTLNDGEVKEQYLISSPVTSSYMSLSIYPPQLPVHNQPQLFFAVG